MHTCHDIVACSHIITTKTLEVKVDAFISKSR